jgi:hypothetical protein
VIVSIIVIYINYNNNNHGIALTNSLTANGQNANKPSQMHAITRAYGVESKSSIGNVYVVGFTNSTLANQTKQQGQDAFILNYNKDGNQVWVKQFGTQTFVNDRAYGVASDSADNQYIVGTTEGSFPGQTTKNVVGYQDAFIAKYDKDGNQVWVKQFGTNDDDVANSVAVDSTTGNAYVGGSTWSTFSGQTNAGGQDAFIAKYDKDGNQVWVKQFGTKGDEQANSVAVDSTTGNAYVVGFTNNTFSGQTNAGKADAFIAKYDKDGNQVWVKQFGTNGIDVATSIAIYSTTGSEYTVGYTNGIFSNQTAKNPGGQDAFIAKYDKDGNQVWVKQF